MGWPGTWPRSSAQEGMWMVTADQRNQQLTLGAPECASQREAGAKDNDSERMPGRIPEGKLGTRWPEAAGAVETEAPVLSINDTLGAGDVGTPLYLFF